jgi:hypothetical protein
MTRLFDLLPAFYRMRDNRIAQSQALLTPVELDRIQNILATLAVRGFLTPDEQQQYDQLRAKASRGPLQSLLMLVEEQLAIFAESLDQLYDDQFIETCAPWVIPYIGDLIGFQPVNGIAPAVASPRAEVAHTIASRRRKGNVLVMEQLARDVTGCGAHAVEFFQVLATTTRPMCAAGKPGSTSIRDLTAHRTRSMCAASRLGEAATTFRISEFSFGR